ncbi:sensor histidine kinase [Nakamurella leprariae]|uniref:histidine kinase n=1 Tax=Nakamurella leprariae TaxID=2803911 RepID=A0A938Y5E2_9ACTN|nr:HAMP domain-containing histidine kinase [Nakamurella leprariae]
MTLRTKLLAGIMVLVVAVCAVIAVVTELAIGRYLVQQLDDQLVAAQQRVQFGVGQEGAGDAPPRPAGGYDEDDCSGSAFLTLGGASDGTLGAKIWGGQVRSAGIASGPQSCLVLDASQVGVLMSISPTTGPVTVTVPGQGDYRVVGSPSRYGDGILVTGLPLEEVEQTQRTLALVMAAVTGIALIAAGGGGWLLVRRSLRPLDRVAQTAREVSSLPLDRGEVDLGVRVPAQDTDPRTEVGQVGAALNQMLGHVSQALEARHESETRVRQFVADASHELRTPLAAIRGYADLARRDGDDQEAVDHALRRVQSESRRMTSLVDDLLLLARLDSGRPLSSDEVDLTMVVLDAVSDARVAGPEHRWQLDLPDEPVTAAGDQARLHQVLTNLLANARTHTPSGTTVVTGLSTEGSAAVLTVTDDGPGIAPDLQPQVFNRFVRGDTSRSRAAGSTGLGLSIVAAVVSAHGGHVSVSSRPGRTVFTVRLPRA